MQTKHKIQNLIILDESGSMSAIKNSIISGFNEVVQTIKGVALQFPDQEHIVTMITFNGFGIKTLIDEQPVEKLNEIDGDKYLPNSITPLFDAMGFGINKLIKATYDQSDFNVLVTILTDGEENSSIEFKGEAIKKLVEDLKQKNWTFTYMGANHDVEKFASSMSIDNSMSFQANESDIKLMFKKEANARHAWSQKIHLNEDMSSAKYFEG